MSAFEYRHFVAFEDTNVLGNVYFVNHLKWQGRCRELFLSQCAPEVLAEFHRGLCFVTTRCSCEYLRELMAFDEIVVRMTLRELVQNRMLLVFEYWRLRSGEEELVAKGEQQIACMRRRGDALVADRFPATLLQALSLYADNQDSQRACRD